MCIIPENGTCRTPTRLERERGQHCPICTTDDKHGNEECSEPETSSYEQQAFASYEAAAQRRAAHPPLVGLDDSVLAGQQARALTTAGDRVAKYRPELTPAQARTAAIFAVDTYLREMRKIED